MSDKLTTQDFEYITGAKQPVKQCAVLRKNGIRFTVRADGSPSLTWEAYNRQLASNDDRPQQRGPNLAAV